MFPEDKKCFVGGPYLCPVSVEANINLAGSFVSDDVADYYATPWDLGYGFTAKEREWLSLASAIGSASLTLILWALGYLVMGGPH